MGVLTENGQYIIEVFIYYTEMRCENVQKKLNYFQNNLIVCQLICRYLEKSLILNHLINLFSVENSILACGNECGQDNVLKLNHIHMLHFLIYKNLRPHVCKLIIFNIAEIILIDCYNVLFIVQQFLSWADSFVHVLTSRRSLYFRRIRNSDRAD